MVTTVDTSTELGRHVDSRLRTDLIAWLTTVRPSGQPDTVPVWFIWSTGQIVLYSRPRTTKLRNLTHNPRVSVVLDDTHGGGDVVRIEGTAQAAPAHPAADKVPEYVSKYAERIRAIGYGTPEAFARSYSVPIVVTPTKIRI